MFGLASPPCTSNLACSSSPRASAPASPPPSPSACSPSACGIARLGLLGWLIGQVFAGRDLCRRSCCRSLLIAAVMVLRGAAEHWRAVVAHETAARVQKALRRTLYDKIASLGPGTVGRQRSGGAHALDDRRRRAARNLFRPVPAAVPDRAADAAADLRRSSPSSTCRWRWSCWASRWWRCSRPALWHKCDVRALASPRMNAYTSLRRRVPRFDPGPRDAEGVRPGQGARRQARGRGARSLPPHHVGAGHQRAGARHHRHLDRLRRGRRR